MKPLKKDATYADLCEVPEHFVAELFDGELYGKDVLVPDIAGWRRERLPTLPAAAYMTLAPDWVCEVISPSTESIDRGKKLRRYAREGVAYVWLVDPVQQALEVLSLESGKWILLARHEGGAHVRAAPFDALEFELGALWI